jgi:hypothetical protein
MKEIKKRRKIRNERGREVEEYPAQKEGKLVSVELAGVQGGVN